MNWEKDFPNQFFEKEVEQYSESENIDIAYCLTKNTLYTLISI